MNVDTCSISLWKRSYHTILRGAILTLPLLTGPILLQPTGNRASAMGHVIRILTLVIFVGLWGCTRWLIERTFLARKTSGKQQIAVALLCAAVMLPALAVLRHTFSYISEAFSLTLGYMGLTSAYQALEQRNLVLYSSPVRLLAALTLGYISLFVLWGAHHPLFIVFSLFPALLEGVASSATAAFNSKNEFTGKTRQVTALFLGICLTLAVLLPGLLGVLDIVSRNFLILTLYTPLVAKVTERYKAGEVASQRVLWRETLSLCLLVFLSALLIALVLG